MPAEHDSNIVAFVYYVGTEQDLLAKHVSDHTGHCVAHGTQHPIAPCDLRLVALRVAELRAAGQTPGTCSPDAIP